MKHAIAFILTLSVATCIAGEWGPVKSNAGRNSMEISTSYSKVNLIWQSQIVPGNDLLLSASTYGSETFYTRYVFLGVAGGSLQIKVGVAHQGKGPAKSDPGSEQLLFVEAAADGSFYFVPIELRDDGHVRVARASGSPGYYTLSVVKSPK